MLKNVSVWTMWSAITCLSAVVKRIILYLYVVNVYLWFAWICSQDFEEEDAEAFDVSLTKNTQGLGITIAGYVGDKNSGEE